MSLPETTLAGMRKTNDLFCSTVVESLHIAEPDHG